MRWISIRFGTMTPRIVYYAVFALYILSFVLPGVRLQDASMSGFDSALIVVSTLKYWNGFLNYAMKVFINLSNILTLLVFLLQFFVRLRSLRWLQLVAFVSGTYWIVSAAYGRLSFATFHVGFWLWYVSLIGLVISTWLARKPRGRT